MIVRVVGAVAIRVIVRRTIASTCRANSLRIQLDQRTPLECEFLLHDGTSFRVISNPKVKRKIARPKITLVT